MLGFMKALIGPERPCRAPQEEVNGAHVTCFDVAEVGGFEDFLREDEERRI